MILFLELFQNFESTVRNTDMDKLQIVMAVDLVDFHYSPSHLRKWSKSTRK